MSTLTDDSTLEASVQEGGESYRWAVMRGLIENRLMLSSIDEHLARVNGTVATHSAALAEIQLRGAQRDKYCPLVETIAKAVDGEIEVLRREVAAVRDAQSQTKAAADERAGLWKLVMPWLQPLVIAIFAALLALIVAHGARGIDLLRKSG